MDRLKEIKARRAAVPDPPYEVEDTRTEEEFYMRWWLIHYGPTDKFGWRDWWAGIPEDGGPEVAGFVANAPADIDWLVGEVEQTEEALSEQVRLNTKMEARAQQAEAQVERLRQGDEFSRMHAEAWEAEAARLRGLLTRLEWTGYAGLACPACRVVEDGPHEPNCWLAAELSRNDEGGPSRQEAT